MPPSRFGSLIKELSGGKSTTRARPLLIRQSPPGLATGIFRIPDRDVGSKSCPQPRTRQARSAASVADLN